MIIRKGDRAVLRVWRWDTSWVRELDPILPFKTLPVMFRAGVPCCSCSQEGPPSQPKGGCELPFAAVGLPRLESQSVMVASPGQHWPTTRVRTDICMPNHRRGVSPCDSRRRESDASGGLFGIRRRRAEVIAKDPSFPPHQNELPPSFPRIRPEAQLLMPVCGLPASQDHGLALGAEDWPDASRLSGFQQSTLRWGTASACDGHRELQKPVQVLAGQRIARVHRNYRAATSLCTPAPT